MSESGADPQLEDLLRFWFGPDPGEPLRNAELWFKKDPEFDEEVRRGFSHHLELTLQGKYDGWRDSPRGALAYIILLDQFSRNIYRDSPRAFAQDPAALAACLEGLARGFDSRLAPMEASFFYMPLMHSENRTMQKLSVQKYEALAETDDPALKEALARNREYAEAHCEVISTYGRFPHRNKLLGRTDKPAELEFLAGPDAGF